MHISAELVYSFADRIYESNMQQKNDPACVYVLALRHMNIS